MLKRHIKNTKGLTLVEMIVSMALLSILLVGAMKIISVNLRTYTKIKAGEEADIVADYLLTCIENEVANATAGSTGKRMYITIGQAKDKTSGVSYGQGVHYYNKDGRESCIYVKDEGLRIHKYAVSNSGGLVDENGNIKTGVTLSSTDTGLPEENYKGFKVKSISFETSMYYRMYASTFTVTVSLYNENLGISYDEPFTKGMTIDGFNGAYIKGPYELTKTLASDTTKPISFVID